ncbi:long-chain-fatty-acid--CoA ligase [Rothia sp. HMSC069C01]|uniref:long-chain-fatty-acid--CoA ligase n=1 Tax=Rothia sp. HMSC069C01 TaxID=1739485 RepID=UPI0009F2F7AB|nr:long-chain-fatty-acid--CoA ligase [Rothia sp. HMSC069C01]
MTDPQYHDSHPHDAQASAQESQRPAPAQATPDTVSGQNPLAHRPWLKNYSPGVAVDVHLSETSLSHLIDDAVREVPHKVALEFFGATTTYSELGSQIDRAAEGLRLAGVQAGDRVALILPNCPQHIIAFYAILRLGAIVVEHNPLYTGAELRHMFEDHGAKAAIVWDKISGRITGLPTDIRPVHIYAVNLIKAMPALTRAALKLPVKKARESREKLEGTAPGTTSWAQLLKSPPIDPDFKRPTAHDVALLQYTSGTTGLPKGVMLTHRNLESNGRMGEAWIQPGDDECIYSVLPLFHAYGMTLGVTIAALCRARLVLFPTVDMGLITKAMKKTRPTILPAVPPVYRRLMDVAKEQGISLQGVRYAVSGAMNLPPELVAEWEEASGGYMVEGYGLTECAPLVSCNPLNDTRRAGSIGIPFPSTDIRVVDPETLQDVPLGEEGELWVHGPQRFAGYWKREEDTQKTITADGWLRTGDIVRLDEDYFIQIVDRIKEVIITGGFNVSPTEVETALKQHDSVADAAVVGIPQASGGELVVAAVIPAEGHAVDEHALREHCYARVTRYKVPRKIVAVDDLPRSMLGKILRRKVREQLITSGELD